PPTRARGYAPPLIGLTPRRREPAPRRAQEAPVDWSTRRGRRPGFRRPRSPAAMCANRGPNDAKNTLQGVALIDRGAQRMPRIDLVDLQGGRIKARVLERPHVVRMRFTAI